jgi:hypothetical protein
MMARTAEGMCRAVLTNTRTEPSSEIDTTLAQMMANMIHVVPAWDA